MDRNHGTLLTLLVAGSLLAVAPALVPHAVAADVHFDVLPLVGCRDVTSTEFAAVNPHERLYEARFQVSSLLPRGNEEQLVQYLYRIESPHCGFAVVDYLPQTTLATDVVEHFSIEKQREDNRSLGITVSGQYNHLAQGTATAGGGKTIKSSVRYDLLPPLELLASSGTVSRGSGVYFKLRPSRRTSLEGAKEFVLMIRVPRDWRGDYVHVRCEAVGRKQSVLPSVESEAVCGHADLLVALYAEGDLTAQQAAASLIEAEQAMRQTVARARPEIRKLAYPHMSLKLGLLPKLTEPKLSAGDVDRFLAQPEQVDVKGVAKYLPSSVQDALTDYATAKRRLKRLNAKQTTLARLSTKEAATQ
jgi:hypothetical protein